MAFLRTISGLAVSLAPMLACTFNAGGLGQTGGDEAGTAGSTSSGAGSTSSGPTSGAPTTDEPTSVGPAGEMSATGSTGPIDPDTTATATATTTVDPSGTTTGSTSTTGGTSTTSAGDESSSGGGSSSGGCMEQVYFKDMDGDGFGDPKMNSKPSCMPPGGYVDNSGDCDDKKMDVNPDAPEKCDKLDNDCDKVLDEFDPETNVECGGCKMYLYPANNRVYYFCDNPVKLWAEAKAECEKRGGTLVKDLDMAHHDWMLNLLPGNSGPWWIGASSPNNDSIFKWIDGTMVPNPDPRWGQGRPLLLGDDRLVLVSNGNQGIPWNGYNGRWYDRGDIDHQPYICESAYLP